MAHYKVFNKQEQQDINFLKSVGLKTQHKILDLGCGGGRLGYGLITYLDKGNYHALDKETNWIKDFKKSVIDADLDLKDPKIIESDFDFNFRDTQFDYVYSYSVFTHVGPDKLRQCLNNLKRFLTIDSKFYATMTRKDDQDFQFDRVHPGRKGEYLAARYSYKNFEKIAKECGYKLQKIDKDYRVGPGHSEDATTSGNQFGHTLVLLTLAE